MAIGRLRRHPQPLLEQKRQERRYETAGRLIRIRITAATLWFLFNCVFGFYAGYDELAVNVPVTGVYWAISLALVLAGRGFSAVLRHSWLAIPFLDLPVIFLAQLRGIPIAGTPMGYACFSIGLLAILVVIAQLSMRVRNVLLTTAVAIVLEIVLLMRGGLGPYWWIAALIVLSTIGFAASAVVDEFSSLLHDVVAERTRISREIHDTLAQGLAGISVHLEGVASTMGDSPEAARRHLDRARETARSSLDEARRSVWNLRRPPEAVSLSHGLREAVQRLTADTPAQVRFRVIGTPRRLPAEVEANVLRIAQEALANASKHAGAARIDIELRFRRGGRLFLTIRDDGRGFDPDASFAAASRFGLTGMHERAEQLGAMLSVQSREGRGTEITLAV